MFKIVQKQTYTFLSHRYGMLLIFSGVILVIVSAFQFGEVAIEWSQDRYSRLFNIYHDNIANKAFENRMCLPIPIDAVYTWVNGSDEKLLKDLDRVTRDLEQSSAANATADNTSTFHCRLKDCIPAALLVAHPLLDRSVSVDQLQAIEGSLSKINRISNITQEAGKISTLLQFSKQEDVEAVMKAIHSFTLNSKNYTLSKGYLTSDFAATGSVALGDRVLLTGVGKDTTLAEVKSRIGEAYKEYIGEVNVESVSGVAIAFITNSGKITDLVSDAEKANTSSTLKVNRAYLVWNLEHEESKPDDDYAANRFEDNEELRYSLRSLEKHAPWIRRVYVVTNGQIPAWLNLDNPRIVLVSHDEIFQNQSHLPSFSSPAIESHIHRIPGLSKKFVYLNDDTMFGKDIWPDDFYTHASGQKVYLTWPVPNCAEGCPSSWIKDNYCDKACNNSECEWDGGDCEGVAAQGGFAGGGHAGGPHLEQMYCNTGCANGWIADKYCDQACNVPACGFDAGDCGKGNFKQLYSVPITHDSTHVTLPKGLEVAFFNLTSIFGEGSTITEGRYDNRDTVRTATIAQKFKTVHLVLYKNMSEASINFTIRGKDKDDAALNVTFTVVANTKENKNLMQELIGHQKGDEEEPANDIQEENLESLFEFDDVSRERRGPKVPVAWERGIPLPGEPREEELSEEVASQLKELAQQLEDGDITQTGHDRLRAHILSYYMKSPEFTKRRQELALAQQEGRFLPDARDIPEAPALGQVPMVKVPVGQVPVGQVPVGKVPFDQVPVGQVPLGQVPVGKVPVGQVPVGQVPFGQVPVGKVPFDQVPVGQVPVGQVPVGQVPVGKVPFDQVPVGQVPRGQVPVGKAPVGQIPLGQVPVGQVPVGQDPVGRAPVGQVPLGQVPLGQVPVGQVPIGQVPQQDFGQGQVPLQGQFQQQVVTEQRVGAQFGQQAPGQDIFGLALEQHGNHIDQGAGGQVGPKVGQEQQIGQDRQFDQLPPGNAQGPHQWGQQPQQDGLGLGQLPLGQPQGQLPLGQQQRQVPVMQQFDQAQVGGNELEEFQQNNVFQRDDAPEGIFLNRDAEVRTRRRVDIGNLQDNMQGPLGNDAKVNVMDIEQGFEQNGKNDELLKKEADAFDDLMFHRVLPPNKVAGKVQALNLEQNDNQQMEQPLGKQPLLGGEQNQFAKQEETDGGAAGQVPIPQGFHAAIKNPEILGNQLVAKKGGNVMGQLNDKFEHQNELKDERESFEGGGIGMEQVPKVGMEQVPKVVPNFEDAKVDRIQHPDEWRKAVKERYKHISNDFEKRKGNQIVKETLGNDADGLNFDHRKQANDNDQIPIGGGDKFVPPNPQNQLDGVKPALNQDIDERKLLNGVNRVLDAKPLGGIGENLQQNNNANVQQPVGNDFKRPFADHAQGEDWNVADEEDMDEHKIGNLLKEQNNLPFQMPGAVEVNFDESQANRQDNIRGNAKDGGARKLLALDTGEEMLVEPVRRVENKFNEVLGCIQDTLRSNSIGNGKTLEISMRISLGAVDHEITKKNENIASYEGTRLESPVTHERTKWSHPSQEIPAESREDAVAEERALAIKDEQDRKSSFLPWERTDNFNNLTKILDRQARMEDYSVQTGARRRLLDTFGDSLRHVNKLYNKKFGYQARKVPAHMPHMIDVGIMYDLQAEFAGEFDITSSHRLRHPRDMQYAFSYFYYLMGTPKIVNVTEVFDEFDTDKSGVLSDREIRTLATRLYDLPLDLKTLTSLESMIIRCAENVSEKLVQPAEAAIEKYYEEKMPQVTKDLMMHCPQLVEKMQGSVKGQTMYKYEIMGEDEIAFKMIQTNVSKVIGQLDDIRKNPKKFVCLNDNIEHRNNDAYMVKAVLQDFYESLFPIPSQFELPREYRNRFLHVDELREWRKYRDWLRFWTHLSLAALITFSVVSFCSSHLLALKRRCCGRRRWRASSIAETVQHV